MDGDGSDEQGQGRGAAGGSPNPNGQAAKSDPRKARLAAALRENLKRRKAQARERRGSSEG
jgi:hypothetical protein